MEAEVHQKEAEAHQMKAEAHQKEAEAHQKEAGAPEGRQRTFFSGGTIERFFVTHD